jgi:cellobiose transport system substrate-binding protein
MDALTGTDPFFGDQVTIDVFGPAAENIPVAYESPYDSALSASFYNELSNVETSGKDPAAAWDDAVSQARDLAAKEGVS